MTAPDTVAVARMIEAIIFVHAEPVSEQRLAELLPHGADITAALTVVQRRFAGSGLVLEAVAGGWRLRTAEDVAHVLSQQRTVQRSLSKAALETLAIIAYHQPVSRAEIDDIRGVSISKGVLDSLMEIGWVRLRGRRAAPGRPVTYGTTAAFLQHFGLRDIGDLPGAAELKAMGVLDAQVPADFDPLQLNLLRDDDETLDDPAGASPQFVEDFLDAADHSA